MATDKQEAEQRRAYQAFRSASAGGRLEKAGEPHFQMLDGSKIAPLSVSDPQWNESTPHFWEHHQNSPSFYEQKAAEYTSLQKELQNGRSPEELQRDQTHADAARFWKPVPVDHYQGQYFASDQDGHHRVAVNQKHGLGEMPVNVQEYRDAPEHRRTDQADHRQKAPDDREPPDGGHNRQSADPAQERRSGEQERAHSLPPPPERPSPVVSEPDRDHGHEHEHGFGR